MMASMSEATFTQIESERLGIRRFKDSDLVPFMAYRNDPEVAACESDETHGTDDVGGP
jgi:hypothetical protein